MTLPTRADGSVDWKLLASGWEYADWGWEKIAREAAAHTRERCARVADQISVQQENDHGAANTGGADEVAAAIRRMED